jgi:hypothetical protein
MFNRRWVEEWAKGYGERLRGMGRHLGRDEGLEDLKPEVGMRGDGELLVGGCWLILAARMRPPHHFYFQAMERHRPTAI